MIRCSHKLDRYDVGPVIIGAHSIIYSTNPDADRAFLRDVLAFTHVDVGGGWLIFGLPPSEVAVHPSEKNDVHQFYLMCDDVEGFITQMKKRNIACSEVRNEGWGLLTQVTLPGGGKLGIYQPRHARPKPMRPTQAAKRSAARSGQKKPRKKSRQTTSAVSRANCSSRSSCPLPRTA